VELLDAAAVHADREKFESQVLPSFGKLAKMRHLGLPCIAPECPEVEDDDLSPMVSEIVLLPGGVEEREGWGALH